MIFNNDRECKYCDKIMEYESEGFMDCVSSGGQHYTVNIPFYYCDDCDYQLDVGEIDYYDED